jgi:hypothetical protein
MFESDPTRWVVDEDTRAVVGAEGDVHGTNMRSIGTPRSRKPKNQAMVDSTRTTPHITTQVLAQKQHAASEN